MAEPKPVTDTYSHDELTREIVGLFDNGLVSRDGAKLNLMVWAMVLAALDDTSPEAVFHRFWKSAPAYRTQRQIMSRLRQALIGNGHLNPSVPLVRTNWGKTLTPIQPDD